MLLVVLDLFKRRGGGEVEPLTDNVHHGMFVRFLVKVHHNQKKTAKQKG